MPLPAFVPLALTGASVLGGVINSLTGPRNPFNEEDIQRYLQLQQSRALAEDASSTRRRLAAAGLGGSGVVNSIISDQASRIRNQFEEQRQKLLLQLKQSQYEQGLQSQQNRAGLFGNLASLGFGLYQAGQPNPFQGQLDQLSQLMNTGANQFQNFQSQQNLSNLQSLFQNNPYQSPVFGPEVNLNNLQFSPLPAARNPYGFLG